MVCDIAWKAQLRLTTRFRRLVARGKAKPKVATAIARELSGFVGAIAQEVSPTPRSASARDRTCSFIDRFGGTVTRWRTLEVVKDVSFG